MPSPNPAPLFPCRATLVLGACLLLACPSIAQTEPPPREQLQELLDGLDDPDPEQQEACRQALIGYGHEIIPVLARRLRQPGADLEVLVSLLEEAHRFASRDAPAGAEVVLQDPQVERFLVARVEHARGLMEREDLDGAQRLLEGVLALAGDGPARSQARQLRREVQDELMRRAVVRGEIVTAGDRFAIDELIEVRLRLTNSGSAPLRIPVQTETAQGVAETVLVATVVYRIFDPLGHMLSTSSDLRLEVSEDIELGPGESWETSFLVEPGQDHPTVMAVRTYTVAASMRPVAVVLPTESLHRRITFPERVLSVFPLGWEKVADRPLDFLAAALADGDMHSLAVACWLIPQARKAEAVDLLAEGLRGAGPGTETVLMAGLERLTGRSQGRDRAAWLHWWQNVKEDWQPPTPEED